MKIIAVFAIVFLCSVSAFAQDRISQLSANYQLLAAQEMELTQTLKNTQESKQQVQGMIRERQVADKEITGLKKRLEKAEKPVEAVVAPIEPVKTQPAS